MKKGTKFALFVAGAVVLGVALLETWERVDYDRERWRADFAQFEAHVGSVYANLEWAAQRRNIDLMKLHSDTLAALDASHSSAAATEVIEQFVETFGDPHFRVERPTGEIRSWFIRTFHSRPQGEFQAPPAPTEGAMDVLGYRDGGLLFRIPFDATGRFERVPGTSPFPSGVLTLQSGKRVGILRIADFRPTRYRWIAERLWPDFWNSRTAAWREEDEFEFQALVSNALLASLAERVEQLAMKRIDALVVDVTQNGGGTEWANEAARVFTPKLLAPPQVAFIRHPHWSEQFEEQEKDLATALARTDLRASTREFFERERARVTTCLDESRRTVDRSRIWTEPGAAKDDLLYAGPASRAPAWPDDIRDELGDRRLKSRSGVWSGRLFVLVDGGSASATEAFTAMLQDNEAATIVGAKTYGAGQGYTNGGIPCVLKNSGLTIRMPDSARLRKDGSPEIEGIEPDLRVPWEDNDSGETRAQKVVEALEKALASSTR